MDRLVNLACFLLLKKISQEERYRCPVTRDVLRNANGVVVLKPTGDVVTAECVEKIIKKDMVSQPYSNIEQYNQIAIQSNY